MPRVPISEKEYYHIFNRGVEKRAIFLDDRDRWRFITTLVVSQGEESFPQINRAVPLIKQGHFDKEIFQKILDSQYTELVSFCLMPNHFHLIMRELREGGISKYMQRVLTAHTKYFNTRHGRAGHLFGSKFQYQHIDSNEYLNYLSAYVHLNPRELKAWHGKEIDYPWSSFQDYATVNRWGPFLNPSIVLEQFDNGKEYRSFVEDTPIKEIREFVENA
ncbi:MAG: transposase [Patescibacteria group bacterium]